MSRRSDRSGARTSGWSLALGPSRRSRLLSVGWVVWLVVYSAGRALAVVPTLAPYGVNPWWFLSIDVGSAFPLAIGQVRCARALRERDAAAVQLWVAIVIVSFVSPYAYVGMSANRPLPTVAYVALVVLGTVFGGATVFRILRGARDPGGDAT